MNIDEIDDSTKIDVIVESEKEKKKRGTSPYKSPFPAHPAPRDMV
jgi:hypothetical protein